MATDFMQRLVKQALFCFALMACLTLIALFSSKVQWGFLGYPALLIGGTFFTTLGVVIGDALRRFTKPDLVFASDGIGLFKAKVFWLIGPQVIGWIIGWIATQGFLAHVPGVADAAVRARIEAVNLARVEASLGRDVPIGAMTPPTPVGVVEEPVEALPATVDPEAQVVAVPSHAEAIPDADQVGQCVIPKFDFKPNANPAAPLVLQKPVEVKQAPDPAAAQVGMLTELTPFSVQAAVKGYGQLVTVPNYDLPDPDQAAGKVIGWVLLRDMDYQDLRNCN